MCMFALFRTVGMQSVLFTYQSYFMSPLNYFYRLSDILLSYVVVPSQLQSSPFPHPAWLLHRNHEILKQTLQFVVMFNNILVSSVVNRHFKAFSFLSSLSSWIRLVALLCILYSFSMCLIYGIHVCMQYSKWDLAIVWYKDVFSSSSQYDLLFPKLSRFPFNGAWRHSCIPFSSSPTFILNSDGSGLCPSILWLPSNYLSYYFFTSKTVTYKVPPSDCLCLSRVVYMRCWMHYVVVVYTSIKIIFSMGSWLSFEQENYNYEWFRVTVNANNANNQWCKVHLDCFYKSMTDVHVSNFTRRRLIKFHQRYTPRPVYDVIAS